MANSESLQVKPEAVIEDDTSSRVSAISALIDPDYDDAPAPDESPEPEQEAKEPVAERPEGDDPAPDESPQKVAKPKNLQELAERLEVEVKDIFDIEFISEGDGESHTLGEMKDLLKKDSDFSSRELELSERKIKQDNEVMRAKQQMQIIFQGLPAGTLTPELLAQSSKTLDAHLEDESRRLLSVIPEWSDPTARQADLEKMGAHMEQYGYSAAEVNRLNDHRMVKYIRDNMTREKTLAAALENVKEVKKLPKGQGKSRKRAAPRKIAQIPVTRIDKVSAIANLLTPE